MLEPYYSHNNQHFYAGHVLDVWPALAAQGVRVQCVVTSIPYYGLRSYGTEPQIWGGDADCAHDWQETKRRLIEGGDMSHSTLGGGKATSLATYAPVTEATCTRCAAWRGELGQEPTPDLFVAHIVAVFRAVRQVLRPDGTLWLNIGDSYANDSKWGGATGGKHVTALHGDSSIGRQKRTAGGEKQLLLMPARVALALQADGWVLRDDIAWVKAWQDDAGDLDGNAMPYSRTDAFTPAWEHVFLLSPGPRYYFDMEAVKTQSGAHPRNVFRVNPQAYSGAHFACFPPALVKPCILAGTSAAGCCPACGAPYRRVVERTGTRPANVSTFAIGEGADTVSGNRRGATSVFNTGEIETRVTVGWQPSCRCNVGAPQPCLVADPFLGSGTTAAVAYELGRGCYGGDLNPTYLDLAVQRVASVTPWYARPDAPAREADYGPLFAGVA